MNNSILDDSNYDSIEKNMLDEYFEYLKSKNDAIFIHWNMRDTNYGFHAIEHRYKVLGGQPIIISDNNKFDLSRVLIDVYGDNYIDHQRLIKIIDKNMITKTSFLLGKDEAKAFEEKEYIKLHLSTLRKTDALESIFCLLAEKRLKTNKKRLNFSFLYFQTFIEEIQNHWIIKLLSIIVVIVTIASAFYGFYKFFKLI
jgi:hypothetical protein